MADNIENTHLVKYIILQTTTVVSLLSDTFILVYFAFNWRKEIQKSPQNHGILCLLIVSFIQKVTGVPFILYFYRWGMIPVQKYNFCAVWSWLDYSLICTSLHVLTWCCLERHLFVFYTLLMKRRKYLVLFHYIPLIISLIYISIFYAVFILTPMLCINRWNYKAALCGAACYSYLPFWGTFDWSFHYGIPLITVLLSNTCLFIRVCCEKTMQQQRETYQPIQRKRRRHLVLQMVVVSILFLILLAPLGAVGVIQALFSPYFMNSIQSDLIFFMGYFSNQLLPFVIISLSRRMRRQLYKAFRLIFIRFTNRTNTQRIHPTRVLNTRRIRSNNSASFSTRPGI